MGDWREKVRQITSEEALKQQEKERIREEEARRAQEFLEKIGTRELLETVKTEAWKVGTIRNLRSRWANTVAIQLFHVYPAPAEITEATADMFGTKRYHGTGIYYESEDIRSITVGLHIFSSEGFLLYVVRDSYGHYSGDPISDGDWAYNGRDFGDYRLHFNKPERTIHIDRLDGNGEDARGFIEDNIAGHIFPLPLQMQKEGADDILRYRAMNPFQYYQYRKK